MSCLEQGLRLKARVTGRTGEGTAGVSSLHTSKGLPAPVLGQSCQDGHIPGFWRTVFGFKQEDQHQRQPSPHLRRGRTTSLSLAIPGSLSPRLKMLGFWVPLDRHYVIKVHHQRPQTPKLSC